MTHKSRFLKWRTGWGFFLQTLFGDRKYLAWPLEVSKKNIIAIWIFPERERETIYSQGIESSKKSQIELAFTQIWSVLASWPRSQLYWPITRPARHSQPTNDSSTCYQAKSLGNYLSKFFCPSYFLDAFAPGKIILRQSFLSHIYLFKQ